jgi:hypothetical protein
MTPTDNPAIVALAIRERARLNDRRKYGVKMSLAVIATG